jgi:hypothetical protein
VSDENPFNVLHFPLNVLIIRKYNKGINKLLGLSIYSNFFGASGLLAGAFMTLPLL